MTLLKRDVWKSRAEVDGKKVAVLNVRIKTSKTAKSRSQPVIIQLFGNGTKMCPIIAAEKYMKANKKGRRNKPFFREASGKNLSLRKFNDCLRMVLEEKIPYGAVTAHSFRAGLATWMASQGSTTEEIQAAGRWTSSAWEVYVKGQSLTRVQLARRLAGGLK